jgi:hypothetical protein
MCNNCGKKVTVDEDLLDSLIMATEMTLEDFLDLDLKQTTDEPTFKINKKMGEGEATKPEKEYRQSLQDLIKQVWDKQDKLNDSKLKNLIDNLFVDMDSEGKELATDFINEVYTTNAETMVKKLKELGIKKKIPKTSTVLDALITWQCFAVEKMGVELYYGIVNQRLGKQYFEAAYGSKE